ncbi:MAG: branched-chain amino acid ABC transporter substrate-binding protein [Candidatus Eremiobacteraeota bacterium]|nr:branched-chain amino acid ABC transporter substrate-binding protein [Candidatus Eremiobacteraeota bacterium]
MRLARVASAALSLALLWGCTSSSTTTQSSTTAGSAANIIKIGVELPLSGGDASNGIPTDNGVKLAVDEANKTAPAGFTFAVYDLDDAVQGTHDPALGAQNTKTFIADAAVLGMVGPFNSNVAKAEIPLTNDAQLTQISPSNTNPGLTKGDDAKKLRTSHPDVNSYFRVCATDDKQGAGDAALAKQLGLKKAFIVDDNETYGKGLADVFEAQFKKNGGAVLGHEHLTAGQKDFKALLTKARSLGPDVVYYGGTTVTGGGNLRKQMGDAGMGAIPYVGGDGISDDEFLKTAGALANGSYYTVAAPEVSKIQTAKDFIAAYKAKYNSDVGPYSANAYTAAKIEIAAIEKAISENGGKMPSRLDVTKNVAATKNFDSPIGTVGFDLNGDTTAPILTVYKIVNGKAQFFQTLKS